MWHKLFSPDLISVGNIVRKRVSNDVYDGFKVYRVTKIEDNIVTLHKTHVNGKKLHPEKELLSTMSDFFCVNCCDIWSGVETVFEKEELDSLYSH